MIESFVDCLGLALGSDGVLDVNILGYLLSAAGLIGGIAIGWFVRHNLLSRHLSQAKKQLEESRSLQITVENELTSLRQKLIQQKDSESKLSSAVKEAQTKTHDTEEKLKQIGELERKIELIQEDNEVLQEQITYLESEKISLQKYKDSAKGKLKHITAENSQLRKVIKNLQAEKEKLKHMPVPPSGGIPRVRRLNPDEWKDIQKQHQSQEEQKEATSRIKQTKSTDRFKSREKSQGETTSFQPRTAPVEYPQQEEDFLPDESSPQGELFPEIDDQPETELELKPVPSKTELRA